MEDEEQNQYNMKKMKQKELYKYYQDKDLNQLFQDLSPSQRKKYLKNIKDNQNIKYQNKKNRYNNKNNNNSHNDDIKKNKSCPRYNNISDDLINEYNPNEYNNMNNNNRNNNNINGNYYNNRELTDITCPESGFIYNKKNNYYKKKHKIKYNNPDYILDNEIFTRITPNFENNSLNNNENNSSINDNGPNISEYNHKKYNNYEKKPSKKSNYIYQKSKTPNKICNFYNKKKKIDYNNNYDNSSIFSDSNNPLNSSNYDYKIDESFINTYNYLKNEKKKKKLNMLLKYGIKLDLNKNKDNDKNNDYIDLITLSDVKNLEKQKKLKNAKNLNTKKNNTFVPNYIGSSINTNTYNNESLEIYNENVRN